VRGGFEPPVPLPVQRFSKAPLSTAQPPHLNLRWERYISRAAGVNRNLSATFPQAGVSEQEESLEPLAETEKKSDRQELLELAIRKLPDNQRVPLALFHFQDMSYDEIAARLGISLAKVKSDIHRAPETLKKLLTT
jgi:RNA polymerase sigma factor (sigma-70 family)